MLLNRSPLFENTSTKPALFIVFSLSTGDKYIDCKEFKMAPLRFDKKPSCWAGRLETYQEPNEQNWTKTGII